MLLIITNNNISMLIGRNVDPIVPRQFSIRSRLTTLFWVGFINFFGERKSPLTNKKASRYIFVEKINRFYRENASIGLSKEKSKKSCVAAAEDFLRLMIG